MESTLFNTIDWLIVDSIIERTASDTITRVRFVRATKAEQSTYEATETQTITDTTETKTDKTVEEPITAERKKNGVAWLCPRVRMALCIIFLVFFLVLWLYVKKSVFLHRT